MYRCLVDVLIRQGRVREAHELAGLARQAVPEEDVYAHAAALLCDASLSTAEGRLEPAEKCFGEALRLLEQQRLPLDLGEARLAYGRALRSLGNSGRAREELESARQSLEGFGAVGLVTEIERELAEMAEGAGVADPLARS
jgi:tetratricopeptide (TPR) repeat protein